MAGEAFVVKELPGPADGDQMIDEDLPFRVRKPAMASGQKRLDVAAGGFADEPAFLKVEFVMDEIARMGLVAAGAALFVDGMGVGFLRGGGAWRR